MIRQGSAIDQLIERTFGNILKFPNPGRWGWIVVALVLALAYWSVARSATSQEELLRLLSLLSFTASIALAEPRIKWPPMFRKPLSLGMFVTGTGLMVVWFFSFGFLPSFSLMALLFAFAITTREMKRLIVV